MDFEATNSYELYHDDEDFCIGHETENDSKSVVQIRGNSNCSFCILLMQFLSVSFQLSVVCGIVFGLLTTLLWWVELNARGYCTENWISFPIEYHRSRLLVGSLEAIIVMFWPLLTIAPICSWSMIKESNVLFWCTIVGFIDVIDRFSLYIFGHFDAHWKSYVGNFLFLLISLIVFYKFAAFRQHLSIIKQSTTLVTLKTLLQIILGFMLSVPYNYFILNLYQNSPPFLRMALSCSLIPVVYVLKLTIGNVIMSIHGMFDPSESIVFSAAFLVISTMVARLTQAGVDSLPYFTIISLAHGIGNVVDKAVLPLRSKIINSICRRSSNVADEAWIYTQQYIAHQSLISIITDTSSVIMSNGAAYIITYYYKNDDDTRSGDSFLVIFKEMFIRCSIAVSIEWIFNVVALYIQDVRCNIPVLRVWKCTWKFIIILHLIQIILFIAYYSHYVNGTLLGDFFRNSTQICVGSFKRL